MSTALVFTSCVDDENPFPIPEEPKGGKLNTNPLISINNIEDENKFRTGDTVKLNFNLSDNVDLTSWRIDIISDEEKKEETEDKIWKSTLEDLNGKISGKEVEVEKIFVIPDNANPGTYKLVIYLINEVGNEISTSIDIEILDTVSPLVIISGLENGTKFKPGDEIKAKLKFSGVEELDAWKISIYSSMDDTWKNEVVGNISGKLAEFEKTIKIPSDVKSGNYKYVVSVTDKAGNENSRTLNIEILKTENSLPNNEPVEEEVVDTTKPTISGSGLENGAKFKPGDEIKAKLILSDDVELASWRINVVPVVDSHDSWKNEISGSVFGKIAQVDETIKIPNNTKGGKYKILVYVTDKAGNEDSTGFDIEVLDTVKPSIVIENSIPSDINYYYDNTITLKLRFSDNVELASWRIKVNHHSSLNGGYRLKKEFSGYIFGNEEIVSKSFMLPKENSYSNTIGYDIEISVTDKAGNVSYKKLYIVAYYSSPDPPLRPKYCPYMFEQCPY